MAEKEMSQRSAAPKAGAKSDTLAVVAVLLGLVLTTFDFIWSFTVAPMVNGAELSGGNVVNIGGMIVTNVQLFSQKIFYFHVPVAVTSFVFIIVGAVFGVLFLMRRDASYDRRSCICFEIGLAFICATMFSGDLWTRIEWGLWWVWEPRLTTYFILMLLVIAYFILRAAIDDPEKRARFCAVFSIVAAVDAPISFMITRLIPSSVHPVVFRTDSGLAPSMLIPFLAGMLGMILIGYALYRLRLRTLNQAREIEDLKARYESLEA